MQRIMAGMLVERTMARPTVLWGIAVNGLVIACLKELYTVYCTT